METLNELIGKSPGVAEAYVRLAEAHRKMGHLELETQALEKLAAAKPDYPMIHVLIAQSMMTADPVDYAKLTRELAAAERAAPNDPDVFYLRGKAQAAQKHFPEAVKALKRSIELRPLDPGAYYQLGLAYQKMGQTVLARETLDRMQYLRQAPPAR